MRLSICRLRLGKGGILLLALVFGLRVGGGTPMDIYTDSLVGGWADYGWATLDYAAASPVHSGSHSISVSAGGTQALYLHHSDFDTRLYTHLTFWIHGGNAGGQPLQVQAIVGSQAQPAVTLTAPVANAWQQRTLSLSSLGVGNSTHCTGFWIQNRSGNPIATFYVDDISLTPRPAPAEVQIAVDATQALRTVDERSFAVNTAVWDADLDKAITLSWLKEMDLRALRFPGGSLSDDYHWASNRTGTNTWTWSTSFAQFARVATNLHAQVFTTVNYGSGTPGEAAAWVRHANITNHLGFKYWEIGNECYGGWETDTNANPHDPYTYALRARDYYQQMKAADASIQVGVVAVLGEESYGNGYTAHPAKNSRTGQMHNGWTPVMLATLKSLGITPDFLIYHQYPQNPGQEDDAGILQASASWAGEAADLRQQISDYLGSGGTNVELVCTENNSVSSGPGKQSTSLVNALFLADSLGQVLKTEFNALVWWDLRNGQDKGNNNNPSLMGWRNYGDYGFVSGTTTRYPTFYAAKLLRSFARGGDSILPASSDYPFLSAYAARRSSGAVTLMVINKDPSTNLIARIRLKGFVPDTNGTTVFYGRPQDEAARTGVGSLDLTTGTFSDCSTNFTAAFPSYSITVLTLAPAPPRVSLGPPPVKVGDRLLAQIRGQPRVRYLWQSSTDLTHWIPRSTNVAPDGVINLTNLLLHGDGGEFFRARWEP